MSKAIPVIITNSNVLLYDEQGGEFKPFSVSYTHLRAHET